MGHLLATPAAVVAEAVDDNHVPSVQLFCSCDTHLCGVWLLLLTGSVTTLRRSSSRERPHKEQQQQLLECLSWVGTALFNRIFKFVYLYNLHLCK